MPDNSVKIEISADGKELKIGFANARDELKQFREQAKKDAEAVAGAWKDASTKIGKTMLGLGTTMAAGFGGAGKISADFEANMRRVNAVAKLPEGGLKKLSDQVLALSRNSKSTKSAIDLSDALESIVSRGLKGADAMAVLEQSAKAATAGMTDTKTAATVIGQTMQAYGLQAQDAGKVTDILFKTVDAGAVTFEELAQSMGTASTKAATYGVSLEEVGAAMAVLSRTMPAAEAATSLERAITQLAAPTAESKKELKALGIETGTTALQQKGLIGVLLDIADKTRGMTTEQRKALSSSEALAAAFALTKGKGSEYKQILEEVRTAHGATDAALQQITASTKSHWEELKKQSTNAAIEIGKSVLPVFDSMIVKATEMAKGFNDLDPAQKAYITGMGGMTTATTLFTGGLFLLAPQIAAVPGALNAARLGTVALRDSFLALRSSILLIPLALASVGLALDQYIQNLERVDQINQTALRQDSRGVTNFQHNKKFIGKSPQEAAAMGATKKDIEDLIQGLQEMAQFARDNNSPAHAAMYSAQVEQARTLKNQLPTMGRAKLNLPPIPKAPTDTRTQVDPTRDGLDAENKKKKKKEVITRAQMLAYLNANVKVLGDINDLDKETLSAAYYFAKNSKAANFPVQITSGYRSNSKTFHGMGKAIDVQALGRPNLDNDTIVPDMLKRLAEGTGFKSGINEYSTDARKWTHGTGPHMHLTTGLEKPGPKDTFFVSNTTPSKNGASIVDQMRDLQHDMQAARQHFTDFQMRFVDDSTREIAELEKAYREAIPGAQSAAERMAIFVAKEKEIARIRMEAAVEPVQSTLEASGRFFQQGLQRRSADFQNRQAMAQTLPEDTSQEKSNKIAAEREITEARLAELARYQATYKADGEEARALSAQWALEEAQLKQGLRNLDRQQNEQARTEYEADLEWKRQMGLITAQEYLVGKQNELVLFQLTEEQKREILLQTHDLQAQLAQDQGINFGAIVQEMQGSFSNFLNGAINGQANFNSMFANLWKQLAGQVLQQLGAMIIKALALQKILSAIFGWFGGILGFGGGDLSIISGGPGEVFQEAVTAHTGGIIGRGYLQKFHSGGGVGWNIKPDEQLALLRVGEAVLNVDQVRQARRGTPTSAGGTRIGQIISQSNDPRMVAAYVGREIDWKSRGLQ